MVQGKISQLYHHWEGDFDELLLQLHAPGKGKQLLKIIPGKLACITTHKETAVKPSGFTMLLRKYLDNAIIRALYQKDAERIMIFELEKESNYFLIIELFSKGNVILTDKNNIIIRALEERVWKDRTIKAKEPYVYPPSPLNWKTITEKQLYELLQQSQKRNLATALATDLGLGGVYAEELCLVAGIHKDTLPPALKSNEAGALFQTLRSFIQKIKNPRGYMYLEQVTPFPLQGQTPSEVKQTYTEAIDTLNPSRKVSPYHQRIKSIEHMVMEQQEAIAKQEELIILNTAKGERIYEKYAPLHKMLEIVKQLRKNKDWKDIAVELGKEKKIKKVDLKNKKVVIEL